MALNPKFSTGFRNAILNAQDITALFDGGQIDIYSGTQPANADTTEGAGTLLATLDIPDGSTSQVANGAMAADTDWTKGAGWTIAAGVASSDGSQSADSDLSQTPAVALVAGYQYEVTYTVSNYSAGNVVAVVGDTEGTDRSANGTYTEIITAGAGTDVDIRADLDFVGDIDNVAVVLHAFQQTAASGAIAKNGLWQEAAAIAQGTAAWFRLRESGDAGGASTTAIRIDGTVGTATVDLVIANTSVFVNDIITASTFSVSITA
jgi:hypothetical protein